MRLSSLILACLAASAAPLLAQAPEPQGADLKARNEQFLLVGKGEVKGHSLLDSAVICDFKKFIRGVPGVDSSRLLAFRFARDLRAEQLRDVVRGLVKGQPGYSPAELEALLRALAPVAKGSTLELRWGAGPAVEIRAPGSTPVQVPASNAAEAVWTGLGAEKL